MARPLESDYTSQVAYTRALEAYCDTLAQSEQEPVAWQFMNGSNFRKRKPNDFTDLDSDGLPYWNPLYAKSPQRPWVGLTEEEAAECWTTSAEQTWKNFEAKLKEKNT
jgi:hypothetical protein